MFEQTEQAAGKEQWNEAFQTYLRLVVRRRWWLLLPFSVVALGVMGVTLLLPDQYTSETLILVEEQRVPEQFVVPNVTTDLRDRLRTMTQQILSRTRLLSIIEDLNLYEKERSRLVPEELVEMMRSRIEIELVGGKSTRSDVSAFKVTFTAGNARVAQKVTTQLTSLFIEENLKVREQQSEGTTSFLEAQVEKARTNLQRQEDRMREFKSRNLGMLPEQQSGNLQVLAGLQMQLQNLMNAVNRSQERRIYLETLLAQYEANAAETGSALGPGSKSEPALVMAENELARLRNQRSAMQARYTEKHPDIRKIDQEILQAESLVEQLTEEAANRVPEEGANPDGESGSEGRRPVSGTIAQVQSQLKANQTELKNLAASESRLKAQIRQYEARLNLTPMREQQLADVVRDYNLSKKNYEELMQKKLDSELATNMEKRQQGEQFRVLDPPSLPEKPSSPNRMQISLIGGLLGLGLAAGLAFLTDMRDQTLRTEKEIRKVLELPVVIGIPEIRTDSEAQHLRVRHLGEWCLASALILAVVAGELLIYWRG